jgi:hypothetical protein
MSRPVVKSLPVEGATCRCGNALNRWAVSRP